MSRSSLPVQHDALVIVGDLCLGPGIMGIVCLEEFYHDITEFLSIVFPDPLGEEIHAGLPLLAWIKQELQSQLNEQSDFHPEPTGIFSPHLLHLLSR